MLLRTQRFQLLFLIGLLWSCDRLYGVERLDALELEEDLPELIEDIEDLGALEDLAVEAEVGDASLLDRAPPLFELDQPDTPCLPEEPRTLNLGQPQEGLLCGLEQRFEVEALAGRGLHFRIEPPELILELEGAGISRRRAGSLLISEQREARSFSLSLPPEQRGAYSLRVDEIYQLELEGQVLYPDRPFDETGFSGERPLRPARGFFVELLRGGLRVEQGWTDAEGRFQMESRFDGLWELELRVQAWVRVGENELRVAELQGNATYSMRAPVLGDEPLLIQAQGTAEGAFNIADTLYDALQLIQPHIDGPAPFLKIIWQPGLPFPCGSCFSGGDTILLGGQLEDTDEFDDDIILHEFGHYFVLHYSADDSPGGAHRDHQVDPRLAYGEGLAYFFAALVLDDPHIIDTFLEDTRHIDLEAVTQQGESLPVFFGTTTGTFEGLLREELVGGILWDSYDGYRVEEPFDEIELGAAGSLQLLIDYFGEGLSVDVGVEGIDLADWLNALSCALDNPKEVRALARDRSYPWELEWISCPPLKGALNPLILFERGGALYLDSRGPIDLESIQLEQHLPQQGARQALSCEQLPCKLLSKVAPEEQLLLRAQDRVGQPLLRSWTGALALERLLGGKLLPGKPFATREYQN